MTNLKKRVPVRFCRCVCVPYFYSEDKKRFMILMTDLLWYQKINTHMCVHMFIFIHTHIWRPCLSLYLRGKLCLTNSLYLVVLWICAWSTVLIINWCRWAQPTMGGIIHKMVVLAVQENCDSFSVSKPASRVPPEFLFQAPTWIPHFTQW